MTCIEFELLNRERKNEDGKRKDNSRLQIIENNKKPSMTLEIEYRLVLLNSNLLNTSSRHFDHTTTYI